MFLRFALVGFLSVASASFADDYAMGNYKGGGTWVSDTGLTGTWDLTMKITEANHEFEMDEELTFKIPGQPDVKMAHKWTAKPTGHGFFDIALNGKTGGWGHCENKMCQTTVAGMNEAFYFDKNDFYILGNKVAAATAQTP